MTTGTGGMLVTDDEKLAEYTMQMRLLGRNTKGSGVVLEGNDWFMDEIRACIGYYQLLDLNEHIKKRCYIANTYDKAFKNKKAITLIKTPKGSVNSYYQYTIILDKKINRDQLVLKLKKKYNIMTKRIWLPTHQEYIFRKLSFNRNSLLKTEETFNSSLCLPIYYNLTKNSQKKVIKAILKETSN